MKILIRLPNWLGDVVMSTAFVSAVGEFYPGAVIDVIVKKELSGVASLVPGVNIVHSFSKSEYKGLIGVYRFGKGLRLEKYELFFNLPSSLSSIAMAWATRAAKRIGFGAEGGSFLLTDSFKRPVDVHRVDEYVSLLEQFTAKKVSNKSVKLNAADKSKQTERKVLVNFNSEAKSRRMPLEKAISIVNTVTNTFTNTSFSFIGAPKEAVFVDNIIRGAENNDRIENLAGKTNLTGLIEMMAGSIALLTTDSGPAHLANGVGTPVIVLFGAGNEHNTAPYNQQNLTILRAGELDCEPCVRNTCELYGIPKCMQLLDEVKIINALSVYLPHA